MRGVIVGLLAFVVLVAAWASAGPQRTAADAPVPAEYASLHAELSAKLTAFEATLDAQWDDSVGDGRFAGALAAANGNKTAGLLTQSAWTRIIEMLDAFETMGVQLVKLDVQYPVLTPAFHSYLAAHPPPLIPGYSVTAANFIGTPNSFYNKLVTEIRSRGMGVWIEHGTLFQDYSPTPPAGYFAEMRTAGLAATQARYTAERAAESAQLVSQLQPDYYTILEEPDTQAMNFGYFPGQVPIFDESGWIGFVQASAAQIESSAPGSATLLGAGIGTWNTADYLQDFAAMPELDIIDIHIYPFGSSTTDYLQRAIDWADYVHAVSPNKLLTIGEAWTYHASVTEIDGGLDFNTIFGRDVWSFWEPLDSQYLDVLFKLMHSHDFAAVMPFWSQYYFAYLTYGDPALDGLSPIQLIGAAGAASTANVATVTLTETGQEFRDLLAVPKDADGDTFRDTIEAFLGTDLNARCAATSAANDEPGADAWPADFDDNQIATTLDLVVYVTALNKPSGDPAYVQRADLNGNGIINTLDLVPYVTMLNKTCV